MLGTTSSEGADSGESLRSREEKWVVYRGSVYNTGRIYPNALWRMKEEEWDDRPYTARATLVARGLTGEVATAMVNLVNEGEWE